MDKKDIVQEMQKAKSLIESRLKKNVSFSPFVISYSLETGINLVELEKFVDEQDKEDQLTNMVKWLKEQRTYGFLFGSLTTKKKFKNIEDMKADRNYTLHSGALIVGKTPEKTMHLSIETKHEGDKVAFEEHLVDVTNDDCRSFLSDVYEGMQ